MPSTQDPASSRTRSPCIHAVAHRVLQLLGTPGMRGKEIADLILLDPFLTLRVLEAVERFTEGAGLSVSTMSLAVEILGATTLHGIVEDQIENGEAPTREELRSIRHGIVSGLAASAIASILGNATPEQARVIALLDDFPAAFPEFAQGESWNSVAATWDRISGKANPADGLRRVAEEDLRMLLHLADRTANDLGAPGRSRRRTDSGTANRMRSLGDSVFTRISHEVADSLLVLGFMLGIPNLTVTNLNDELDRVGDRLRPRSKPVDLDSAFFHQTFRVLRNSPTEAAALRKVHHAIGQMPQVAGVMMILDESGEAVLQDAPEERPSYFSGRDVGGAVEGFADLCQEVHREGRAAVIRPGMGFDAVFGAFSAPAMLVVPLQAAHRPLGVLIVIPHGFDEEHLDETLAQTCGALAEAGAGVLERIQMGRRSFLLTERITKDSHTGLLQRAHFMELFDSEVRAANRYRRPLSLIMLDVDHFKQWNDTYGHQVGDTLLRDVARVLRDTTRDGDLIGRYGGDEFLILLPGQGLEQAQAFAERLRSRVEGLSKVMTGVCYDLPLSISMGVAAISSYPADSGSILFRADHALYRAKEGGRNRVHAEAPEA